MKAVLIDHYGSAEVLQNEEIEQPQLKPDRLLVKVYATSVNPVDWKIRNGLLKGLISTKFPTILGIDLSGEVVALGEKVTRFKPGDLVYANLGLPGGAYAEFAAIPEKNIALKPTNMTHEEAAAVPCAALTALQALRDRGQVKQGDKVLINGASGGVGSFAVQIAKALETEVTAVCSTKNMELVKSLGADSLIDYTQQDFTQDTVQYDIIFDAVARSSFSSCKKILKPNGVYITTLPTPMSFVQIVLTKLIPGKKSRFIFVKPSGQDLEYIRNWIEAGKIRSLIDRTYPLSEIAAAHAYSETQHAVGKIVLIVANQNST